MAKKKKAAKKNQRRKRGTNAPRLINGSEGFRVTTLTSTREENLFFLPVFLRSPVIPSVVACQASSFMRRLEESLIATLEENRDVST